ncbi:MAG: histidinol-phosphatase [Bacteroidetes bacterium]|nr:histidinol-phosphatase [Bacteroidota bacterium]MBI3482013.1 histidinol-phosphatase [Bacteroidota bacterium]
MSWFNFHTHSNYCDGKSSLSEIVEHAKKVNVTSLGFSSHAPLPFESKWCMKKESFHKYIDEIQSLKHLPHRIEIYSGLEVDYIPYQIGPKDFENKLDYTIGSIHFVEKFNDGIGWEIDGPHSFFLEGLEKIFDNDFKKAVARYYELTREMITKSPPSVIGHLDKIKIQNIDNKFFNESDRWYQDEIKITIDAIRKTKSIIEVNTRGVYQKKSATTYPSPWILELIHQKMIPVTISSDAHHHQDLISYFKETAHLLKQIGFKEISILHDGQWKPFEFNANGIKNN